MVNNLFWNVDTINDFMNPGGRLYVPGAEDIKTNLSKIKKLAYLEMIQVINSAEAHTLDSKEISIDNPDFKTTFPPHGLIGTKGADFIDETSPFVPLVISHEEKTFDYSLVLDHRNIVLTKDSFDVFTNPHAVYVIEILEPTRVFVYGVTTEICVNHAVNELLVWQKEVYVIEDAIKEFNLEAANKVKEQWKRNGVKLIQTDDIKKYLLK